MMAVRGRKARPRGTWLGIGARLYLALVLVLTIKAE